MDDATHGTPDDPVDADPISDREEWESVVAAMVSAYTSSQSGNTEKHTKTLLNFLAELLKNDKLPATGRQFLAEKLRVIANDGDAFPKSRKRRSERTSVQIALDVARRKQQRGAGYGDMSEIYTEIARRLRGPHGGKMTASTVAKEASKGWGWIKKGIEDTIAAGGERDVVVTQFANLLAQWSGMPAETIKSYF